MEEKILEPKYVGRKTDVNGFLGDTAYTELRKYDETLFNKYNYSTAEQDSNCTYLGGVDYATGLPDGLTEEQYFQLVLIDKLESIAKSLEIIAGTAQEHRENTSRLLKVADVLQGNKEK